MFPDGLVGADVFEARTREQLTDGPKIDCPVSGLAVSNSPHAEGLDGELEMHCLVGWKGL